MRIFSFLRLSRYIEKVFGPSVAKFFEDFGLYLLILFVILILYSWAGLFYSLLKPFRRKTNEDTEDKEKFELTISRSILKKVTSIGLIFIALVIGGFIFSYLQVDCDDEISFYKELLETNINLFPENPQSNNYYDLSVSLVASEKRIEIYKEFITFLEKNEKCNGVEEFISIKEIENMIFEWEGVVVLLKATLGVP